MVTHVAVPGEPTLLKTTGLPEIRVELPMEVWPKRGFLTVMMTLGLFLLGLPFVLLLIPVIMAVQFTLGNLFLLTLVFVVGAVGFLFVAAAVIHAIDMARGTPVLRIDSQEILDRRALKHPIRWSDLATAIVIWSRYGIVGVSLTARHPIRARRNSLRSSSLVYLVRRRPAELHVSLMYCENARAAAYVILALVRRHGGTVNGLPNVPDV